MKVLDILFGRIGQGNPFYPKRGYRILDPKGNLFLSIFNPWRDKCGKFYTRPFDVNFL